MVVLRVGSETLYDRLKARYVYRTPLSSAHWKERGANGWSVFRNYPEEKLQENLDSEIMEVLLSEARESYDEEIIVELKSDTTDEMESNIERVEAWLESWKKNNAEQ